MADSDQTDLTTLTVDLLSAYFASNTVPSENLASLIQSTRAALAAIDNPAPVEAEAPAYVAAVGIRKSLSSPDHIISMIDGKPYKTLKRHLASKGMTPADYRARYKLPADYPMVAPSYSEQRRAVAEKLGLGRSRGAVPAPQAAAPVSTTVAATPRAVPAKAAPKAKPVASTKPSVSRKVEPAIAPAPAPVEAPAATKAKAKTKAPEAAPAASTPNAPAKKAVKRKLSIAKPKTAEAPAKTVPEMKAAEGVKPA
jgi:predicted transcriptional regulator